MHIEILTEDSSGAKIVQILTRQICEREHCEASINVRPHRGCGNLPKNPSQKPLPFASGLLDLLPAKCRAYNSVYGNTDACLVVIMDSDDNDPTELREKLYEVTHKYAPDLRSVIGLCTEEVEAWLLGDQNAVMKAYPDADISGFDEYVQDSVCGTWEMLCKIVCPDNYEDVREIGYPAIGHYKARWAEAISVHMDEDRNVSPSFINFKNALVAAIRKPGPIKGTFPKHHTRSF